MKMETIYKYPLRCTGYAEAQILELPAGAEILSVASMPNPDPNATVEKLMLWARVDTDNGLSERNIIVCGTGQPFAPYEGRLRFISTFCMDTDRTTGIGHAFELIMPAETEASVPYPGESRRGVPR